MTHCCTGSAGGGPGSRTASLSASFLACPSGAGSQYSQGFVSVLRKRSSRDLGGSSSSCIAMSTCTYVLLCRPYTWQSQGQVISPAGVLVSSDGQHSINLPVAGHIWAEKQLPRYEQAVRDLRRSWQRVTMGSGSALGAGAAAAAGWAGAAAGARPPSLALLRSSRISRMSFGCSTDFCQSAVPMVHHALCMYAHDGISFAMHPMRAW